jgi:hypothetical protein
VRSCQFVRLARLLAPGAAAVCVGCGGGSSSPTTPLAPLVHDGTRPPALPAGWTRATDRRQGLSFGLPPGWTAARRAGSMQVRSADRALALTVAVDRGAQGATPSTYVAATLAALPGYEGLRRQAPRPIVDAPYPAASASATGTLRSTGVRQRIVAIALQPTGLTICSLLAFSSARTARGRYARPLAELVRTVFVR